MVYVLTGILAGGVLTAICWPLFAGGDAVESAIIEETQWDLLQRKKNVVLANIQDLDFEYTCGKLSDDDYRSSRTELTAEVSRVYRDIDRIESEQDMDSLIRTEVAARKKARATPGATKAAATCLECGHDNPAKNKFCAECGTQIR
jgi:hypothetical protein